MPGALKKKILIRADGSKEIGMGHFYRNLRLARFLKKRHGITSVLVTRDGPVAKDLFGKLGVTIYSLEKHLSVQEEKQRLREIVARENPEVVIVDLLQECFKASYMQSFRHDKHVKLIAFLDAYRHKKVAADIIINTSPVEKYSGAGVYYSGFKYLILPEEYSAKSLKAKVSGRVRNIMLCMGGSDHNNLTMRLLKIIDSSEQDFKVHVAVRSVYFPKSSIEKLTKDFKHEVHVYYDEDGLLRLLRKSEMAITAGGYSQVERMAAGVPGLVIGQVKHQSEYSQHVHRLGGCIHLGYHKAISDRKIFKGFEQFLKDANKRNSVARKGKQLVDGQGLQRIANIVRKSLSKRKDVL